MIKDYIAEKCEMLADFGISNSVKLEEHFKAKIRGLTDEAKMEIRIDQMAHDIIKRFLCDGDKTYVLTNETVESIYATLKAKSANCETLYEDVIISHIGKSGFDLLRKHKLIETCAMFNGRKLYAI